MTLALSVILRFRQKIAEKAKKNLEFQKNYFLCIKSFLYCIDGLNMIFFSGQPYGVQGL